MSTPIKFYGLSTCIHCRHALGFLDELNVPYDKIFVDLLKGDERKNTLLVLKDLNPDCSFPTMLIGDTVVVGFSSELTPKELFDRLKPIQESKGFYFNDDPGMTMPLLSSLLLNKVRYSYMACPCRLASGVMENDRDIICPCAYRDQDVAEHQACYCGLYVSKAWNESRVPHKQVPERRPPEKTIL